MLQDSISKSIMHDEQIFSRTKNRAESFSKIKNAEWARMKLTRINHKNNSPIKNNDIKKSISRSNKRGWLEATDKKNVSIAGKRFSPKW